MKNFKYNFVLFMAAFILLQGKIFYACNVGEINLEKSVVEQNIIEKEQEIETEKEKKELEALSAFVDEHKKKEDKSAKSEKVGEGETKKEYSKKRIIKHWSQKSGSGNFFKQYDLNDKECFNSLSRDWCYFMQHVRVEYFKKLTKEEKEEIIRQYPEISNYNEIEETY